MAIPSRLLVDTVAIYSRSVTQDTLGGEVHAFALEGTWSGRMTEIGGDDIASHGKVIDESTHKIYMGVPSSIPSNLEDGPETEMEVEVTRVQESSARRYAVDHVYIPRDGAAAHHWKLYVHERKEDAR